MTRARGRPALSPRRAHRGQRRRQAADTPQSASLTAQSAQRNHRGRTQQGNEDNGHEDNGHEGATYTLTGPASITHTEIAAALTFAPGRDITFTDIPSDALAENLQGILPPWRILGLLENYAHYRRGEAASVSPEVAELTGRPARDVSRLARDYASAFTS